MKGENREKFSNALSAGRWFRGLPEGFRSALLDAGTSRKLAKDEWLFARGDAPSGLYAVVSGAIRISATAPSGKSVLLALVEAPMWFGEICVFDGQPRTHDAIAEEDSVVFHVAQAPIEAILEREPRWWRELGLLAATKLRITFSVMEDAAVLPIATRLARRLVMAAERYGEWEGQSSRVLDLRQEQLATMLSTSRQTVNQVLKDLEAQGLVRLSYGQIEILDLDALKLAAAGE